jgi:hypothetical protein
LPPPQDRRRIRAQHEHIKNVTTYPALTGEGGNVLARLLALNAERAAAERENQPLAPRAKAKRTAKGLAKAELLDSLAADEGD